MRQRQTSFIALIFNSFHIFQKSFLLLFIVSLLGILPLFSFSKIINKTTILVYYFDFPGKYFLDSATPFLVGSVAFFIFFFSVGLLTMIINDVNKGKRINIFRSFREVRQNYVCYIIVKVRCIFQVIVGLGLFIFPGIFWLMLYSFSGFAVLLDEKKVNESFKHSREIVHRTWISYLDYLLVFFGIGAISFGILRAFDFISIYYASKEVQLAVKLIDLLSTAVMITAGNIAYIYFFNIYQEFKERAFGRDNE